jgi:hypothetical protein
MSVQPATRKLTLNLLQSRVFGKFDSLGTSFAEATWPKKSRLSMRTALGGGVCRRRF